MPKQDKQQQSGQPAVSVVADVVVAEAVAEVASDAPPVEPIVLPAVVHFALDLVDRGHATAFGALNDARTELRVAIDGGFDLAEKATAAALRFARGLVHRADDLATETLAGAQRVLATSVATARSSAAEAATR